MTLKARSGDAPSTGSIGLSYADFERGARNRNGGLRAGPADIQSARPVPVDRGFARLAFRFSRRWASCGHQTRKEGQTLDACRPKTARLENVCNQSLQAFEIDQVGLVLRRPEPPHQAPAIAATWPSITDIAFDLPVQLAGLASSAGQFGLVLRSVGQLVALRDANKPSAKYRSSHRVPLIGQTK